MHILIVSTIPPNSASGVSLYYQTIRNLAVADGHTVECVTDLLRECRRVPKFFAVWAIRLARIFGRSGQQVLTRFIYFHLAYFACRGKQADVIFAQDPITGNAARMALKNKVPVVTTCHFSEPVAEICAATPVGSVGKWLLTKWFRWNFAGIQNYICVSNYGKNNILPWLKLDSRITVIHNGATLPAQTSTDLQKPADKKVILNVGRIEPLKNQELLIRAIAAMQRPDVELWLVGDGVQRAELARLAQKLGIAEQVMFFGHRTDVQAIMRLADLYVHVSKMENCPLVIAEAMLNLLPVLATDVGGTKELFPNLTAGVLPATITAPKLATHIASMLDNLENLTHLQQTQYSFATANFTTGKMFERTIAVLSFVISAHP